MITQDSRGSLALTLASSSGHLEVVKALVGAKADVNAAGIVGGVANKILLFVLNDSLGGVMNWQLCTLQPHLNMII